MATYVQVQNCCDALSVAFNSFRPAQHRHEGKGCDSHVDESNGWVARAAPLRPLALPFPGFASCTRTSAAVLPAHLKLIVRGSGRFYWGSDGGD